jgi:hypothetical protein
LAGEPLERGVAHVTSRHDKAEGFYTFAIMIKAGRAKSPLLGNVNGPDWRG